ncbi:MAG: hypothetical protein ACI4YB_02440 [Oscillospiraceae bacterium]
MLDIFVNEILLMYKKPRFIRQLEHDIEKRTLNVGEELGLWAVGIWLFIYDGYFSKLFPEISPSLNAYLGISNFILAAVIVLLIVDSNYRNFYYKQNTKAIRRYYDGRLRSTDTHEKVRANKGNAVEKVL